MLSNINGSESVSEQQLDRLAFDYWWMSTDQIELRLKEQLDGGLIKKDDDGNYRTTLRGGLLVVGTRLLTWAYDLNPRISQKVDD